MLTNWQATSFVLIRDEDYNAHIVYVDDTDRINLIFRDIDIEKNWRDAIDNELKTLINAHEIYTISLHVLVYGIYDIFTDEIKGKDIIDKHWNTIKKCDGFKLKLFKKSGRFKTFIFIKK